MDLAGSNADRCLLSIYEEDKELFAAFIKNVTDRLNEGLHLIDEIRKDSAGDGLETRELDDAKNEMPRFSNLFSQYTALADEKAAVAKSIDGLFPSFLSPMSKGAFLHTEDMNLACNVLRASVANYLKRPGEENWSVVQCDLE
jgi:hypothetical protein